MSWEWGGKVSLFVTLTGHDDQRVKVTSHGHGTSVAASSLFSTTVAVLGMAVNVWSSWISPRQWWRVGTLQHFCLNKRVAVEDGPRSWWLVKAVVIGRSIPSSTNAIRIYYLNLNQHQHHQPLCPLSSAYWAIKTLCIRCRHHWSNAALRSPGFRRDVHIVAASARPGTMEHLITEKASWNLQDLFVNEGISTPWRTCSNLEACPTLETWHRNRM